MKLLFAFVLMLVVLIGFTSAETAKEEIAQVIEENSVTGMAAAENLSILDTVNKIKSTKNKRFLADTFPVENSDPILTLYQAYIWIPIILAVTLLAAVLGIMNMDLNKENDTLIYAKFITT